MIVIGMKRTPGCFGMRTAGFISLYKRKYVLRKYKCARNFFARDKTHQKRVINEHNLQRKNAIANNAAFTKKREISQSDKIPKSPLSASFTPIRKFYPYPQVLPNIFLRGINHTVHIVSIPRLNDSNLQNIITRIYPETHCRIIIIYCSELAQLKSIVIMEVDH